MAYKIYEKGLILFCIMGLFSISGCLYAPKTLAQLRSNPPNRVEVYNLSYQSLAECWQNYAKPTYLDWKRSSFLNIYNEKKYAVVTTGFSLFEIRYLGNSEAKVLSYDGEIHRSNHEKWFEVLRKCEKGEFKL